MTVISEYSTKFRTILTAKFNVDFHNMIAVAGGWNPWH